MEPTLTQHNRIAESVSARLKSEHVRANLIAAAHHQALSPVILAITRGVVSLVSP